MTLAPIALFAYNRPLHLAKVIEALARNPEATSSTLFIYSDAAKTSADLENVASVRAIAGRVSGFQDVNVIEQVANKGVARSIIEGVSEIAKVHGSVIVLEDDLVVSPYFLAYMNSALRLYEHDNRVVSIHGYVYPVSASLPATFFLRGADCWGWATWKRGWEIFEPDGARLLAQIEGRGLIREFDFNGSADYTRMLRDQIGGRNDSWAVRWYASAFLADKLTLYPGQSLVENIGADGSGTHTGTTDVFDVRLAEHSVDVSPVAIEENRAARALVEKHFRATRPSLLRRLRNRAGRLLRFQN